MQLQFEVGTTERHEVVYSWDQMWGRETLAVDGAQVLNTVKWFSLTLVRSRQVTVGTEEKHEVRVDKRRELFFAGFRPQFVTAYVDGQKVTEGISTLSPRQQRSLIVLGIVCGAIVVLTVGITLASTITVLSQQ